MLGMTFRGIRLALLAVGTVYCCMAQAPTGTILGTIADSSGAMLADAKVQLRNLASGEVREAQTGPEGEFLWTALPPAKYEVTAEFTGFRKHIEANITLNVDQQMRLEIRLSPGSVNESIEVQAEAPLLQTDQASRGEVLSSGEISEMPLDGRDHGDLARLVPGVNRTAQGGSGSGFAINGARSDNTNFVLDGFSDQSIRGGGIQISPPIDAMQEFKMQTSGYSAEHGRMAGGVMSMVLKSGGNRYHGAVFHYLRNNIFDARDFFDAQRPPLRRNQFGAVVNGPLRKNKTFFLASWESYRQVLSTTRLNRVPTPREKTGDFSRSTDVNGAPVVVRDPIANANFPGNIVPASRLDAIALRIQPYFPAPNKGGMNNYRAVGKDNDQWDVFLGKIDHKLSEKDQLGFRMAVKPNRLSNPFSGSDLGTFGNFSNNYQMLAGLNWTRMFRPTLIGEFRVGFNRVRQKDTGTFTDRDIAGELGLAPVTDPDLYGFPRVTIRDYEALGDNNDQPLRFAVSTYEAGGTMTWVKGSHLMKGGGTYILTHFGQTITSNLRGTYNFLGRWTNDPYADFLLGLLNNSTRRLDAAPSFLSQRNLGLFVQDDWKIKSNLTLNIGLRYEWIAPMRERFGRLGNFVPELGKVVIASRESTPALEERLNRTGLVNRVTFASEAGLPPSLVFVDKNNFAPRFGFAWRPGNATNQVVRASYGIFYGINLANPIRGDLSATFPFSQTETYNRLTTDPNLVTLRNPFPGNRTTIDGALNAAGYQTHARTGYLQSWNWTYEREVFKDSAIDIAYMGSKGTHLGRRYDVNQPTRDPALRPSGTGSFPRPISGFNTINYYSFNANSTYHAGTITFRRRLSRGFFYRASYVFSKSLDDASQISGNSAGGYPGVQDLRNLRLERGRSDWDNGHAILANFSYEFPWRGRNFWRDGWQIAGTARAYTGQPFTPRTSNVQLDQGEANRPDRIAKGRRDERDPDHWFDLTAFPVVPVGGFRPGNSGRNILDGPGFQAWNVSLLKRFQVPKRERDVVQLRIETFNSVNRANFQLPNNNVNAANGGTIVATQGPRRIQFALKYLF
jgi:hypothetical protein